MPLNSNALSVHLNKLLAARGWSTSILADRAGVCYQTARRAITGADVSYNSWLKIAAGLGTSYEALAGQVPLEANLLDDYARELLQAASLLTEERRALLLRLAEELVA